MKVNNFYSWRFSSCHMKSGENGRGRRTVRCYSAADELLAWSALVAAHRPFSTAFVIAGTHLLPQGHHKQELDA